MRYQNTSSWTTVPRRRARRRGGGPAPVLREIAQIRLEAGDTRDEAICLFCLGKIALTRSDRAARAAFDQALPMLRHVGNRLGEGNVHPGFGDLAGAERASQAARDGYRRCGDPLSVAGAQSRLSALASGDGLSL